VNLDTIVACAIAAAFIGLVEWARWLDANSSGIVEDEGMYAWRTWRREKVYSAGDRVVDQIFGPGEVTRVRCDGQVFVRFDRNDGADLLMSPNVLEREKGRAS
jgi:hypothetical protein